MANKLILIKLGGSVITNKNKEFSANPANIRRLGKEIAFAAKLLKGKIIIGHGGGSFPHTPAAKYKTKLGILNHTSIFGMSLVEDAARKLNMILVENFLTNKLPVFTFSPSSWMISDTQRVIGSYLDPIKKAVDIGIIPVVYGDVVIDKKQGCTIISTERVIAELVKKFRKEFKIKIILVTNTNGVYNSDGKTIPLITVKNFNKIRREITGSGSVDVTGGMLHKVVESLKLAKKYDVETIIINGNKKYSLKKAILGEKTVLTKIFA